MWSLGFGVQGSGFMGLIGFIGLIGLRGLTGFRIWALAWFRGRAQGGSRVKGAGFEV